MQPVTYRWCRYRQKVAACVNDGSVVAASRKRSVNAWITSIQPPGLMTRRFMHHQEQHQGHQAPQNSP